MDDLISRRAAINAIENTDCELSADAWDELTDAIMQLPSAQPEPSQDCVDREYLIEHLTNCFQNGRTMHSPDLTEVLTMIEDIPSAQPEQKYGGWIKMSDSDGIYFACSVCGEDLPRFVQRFDPQFDLFPRLESIDKTNYCPNCGADMRGEKNDK